MKQLTKVPGPSDVLWVVWKWKYSDGIGYWSASGMFSERHHAEEHAESGNFVGRYGIQAKYRATNILLEEDGR